MRIIFLNPFVIHPSVYSVLYYSLHIPHVANSMDASFSRYDAVHVTDVKVTEMRAVQYAK